MVASLRQKLGGAEPQGSEDGCKPLGLPKRRRVSFSHNARTKQTMAALILWSLVFVQTVFATPSLSPAAPVVVHYLNRRRGFLWRWVCGSRRLTQSTPVVFVQWDKRVCKSAGTPIPFLTRRGMAKCSTLAWLGDFFVSFYFFCHWILVECLISRLALSAWKWQLYSAVLCFPADALRSSRMRLWTSDCRFTQRVFDYPPKWCTYIAVCLFVGGATWDCCRVDARFVYNTIQLCTSSPVTSLPYSVPHT